MSRRGRIFTVVLLVATLLVVIVALRLFNNTDRTITANDETLVSSQNTTTEYVAELRSGKVAEVLVDMGDVSGSTLTTTEIRIDNLTDVPIVLLDYEATCRCVWLDLPREAIAVGESRNVTLYFDSRGERGSIGNYISISTSDKECSVAIWMAAEVAW